MTAHKLKRQLYRHGSLVFLLIGLLLFLTLAPPAAPDERSPALPAAADSQSPVPPAPDTAAKAVAVLDRNSGRFIYTKNPDMELPMASTTKMMTALLIAEDGHNMNDMVTCSERCATIGESSIYLTQGESLTVRQMLYGLLLPSGNDAAIALAEYDAGSVEAFVAKMNRRAAELGMTHTHFVTPHGLDEPGHYASAEDLARLGAQVMKHKQLREIVKTQVKNIPGYGSPTGRTLININHLLKYPYVDGIKTGYTDNAGQCIVVSAEQNGVSLVVVYLGGPTLAQRDQDVYNLIQYGFANYSDRTVIQAGKQYASLSVPYSHGKKLALISAGSLTKRLFNGDQVQNRLVLPSEPALPVRKGDKVGLVEAFDGSTMLGSTYLVAANDAPAPSLSDRIFNDLSSVFHVFGAALRVPGVTGLGLAQALAGGFLVR